MKATFTGVPGEKHESVYMYGQNFPLNESVEVTNPTAQRKLANHPHFKVDGEAPVVDDANLRTYVNTVMTAGQQALQREASQTAQQTTNEAPPTPPEQATPKAMRSAQEYQAMEMSGTAPVVPKTAEQLRAELEEAEKAEKESTDGTADSQRASRANPAQNQGARSADTSGAGRPGKGR